MEVILVYSSICVGVWAGLMWAVEKFFRYIDSTELPDVSDEVCPTEVTSEGEKTYGY